MEVGVPGRLLQKDLNMDFDSIVTFVFLLVFFILPSLLKMMARKKKPPKAKVKVKKKPSVFTKIGEEIQKWIRELEEQAGQQEKKDEKSFWEALTEGRQAEEEDFFEDPAEHEEIKPPPLDGALELALESSSLPDEAIVRQRGEERPLTATDSLFIEKKESESVYAGPGMGGRSFRTNPLQNAVIWAEILGRPVALRDE